MRFLLLLPLVSCPTAFASMQDADLAPNTQWAPPPKEGVTYIDPANLPLAERIERNRELERKRLGLGRSEGFGSADSPSSVPDPGLQPATDLSQALLFDAPGDGSLIASGGSYKAIFRDGEASFVPYFGANTPQNYPITMRLARVSSGGQALPIALAAIPVWDGPAAVFDRGFLEERYELAVHQMEQLFVIDERPNTGSLTIELDVETELVFQQTNSGFVFSNERGSVSYSNAVVFDANGHQVSAPTEWTGNGVRITVPEDFLASASLPVVVDPVFTTFDVDDTSQHTILPDIAYDATNANFLVIYERVFSGTDHDIFAERRDSAGSLIAGSGAWIDISSDDWRWASVANNNTFDQFLVVAENRSGPTIEVFGRTREAGSSLMGSQLQISANTGPERFPDVGGDAGTLSTSTYLVVYERESVLGVDHDILGRRFSPLLGPQGGAISFTNTSAYDKFPSISKSNGVGSASNRRWGIAWQREFSATDFDIYGALADTTGAMIGLAFSVSTSGADQQMVSASSPLEYDGSDRMWAVAAQSEFLNDDTNLAAYVLRGSSLVATEILSDLFFAFESEDQLAPSIDSNGDYFTVAWTQTSGGSTANQNVLLSSFYLAGDEFHAPEGVTFLEFGSVSGIQTQVCSRRSGGQDSQLVGVVWREGGAGLGDIHGAVYQMPNGYGNNIGTNYCGPAVVHSGGLSAKIRATGSRVASGEPLQVEAFDLPTDVLGYFVASPVQGLFQPANSSGFLCLSSPISRYNTQVLFSGFTGSFHLEIDTAAIPTPSGVPYTVMLGDSWNFQAWFRDGNTNNFTDGESILFL